MSSPLPRPLAAVPGDADLDLPTSVFLPGPASAGVVLVVVPAALEPESLLQLGERLQRVASEHLQQHKPRPLSAVSAVSAGPKRGGQQLVAGPIEMDVEQLRVRASGREVPLRHQEFRLLRALLENPGRVFSRRQLLDLAWGREGLQHERTVDVHVRRLRAKLGGAAAGIVTVRGFGYRLEAER